jgi:dUTPase
MTLLAGSALDPATFFKGGNPHVQGSSFDLTIGSIFDHEGKKVDGPFAIRPGHMIQVVSAEQLNLSDRHTGHVTYKTTMTRQGIWALTVGIVDPGWQGPITTTLLNFSRVDHSIAEGDAFLRVSMFEHDAVAPEKLRKAPALDAYVKDIRKIAASRFPITFLNTTQIAEDAGRAVFARIRSEALSWVVGIALLFTLLQVILQLVGPYLAGIGRPSANELEAMKTKLEAVQTDLLNLKTQSLALSALGAREPTRSPPPQGPSSTVPPNHDPSIAPPPVQAPPAEQR